MYQDKDGGNSKLLGAIGGEQRSNNGAAAIKVTHRTQLDYIVTSGKGLSTNGGHISHNQMMKNWKKEDFDKDKNNDKDDFEISNNGDFNDDDVPYKFDGGDGSGNVGNGGGGDGGGGGQRGGGGRKRHFNMGRDEKYMVLGKFINKVIVKNLAIPQIDKLINNPM